MRKIAAFVGIAAALYAQTPLELAKSVKMLNQKGMDVVAAHQFGELVQAKVRIDQGTQYKFIDAFITEDGKKVVLGRLYDAKSGSVLTMPFDQSKWQKSIDVSQYEKEAAFKVGSGKRKYYVFVDPMCPFCKRFEKQSRDFAKNANATLFYFLFPLNIPSHKDNRLISAWVLSKKPSKRADALAAYMVDGDMSYKKFKPTPEQTILVDRQVEIADKLGIRGAPTIIDDKGKPVKNWMAVASGKVDARALDFLKKNVDGVVVGKGNPVVAIVDPSSPEFKRIYKSKAFSEFIKSHKVYLYPYGTQEGGKSSVLKSAYVYFGNTPKERKATLDAIVMGDDVEEKARKVVGADSGSEKLQRSLKVAYIVDQLGLTSFPVFYDVLGNSIPLSSIGG